jgi:hypothetical protein
MEKRPGIRIEDIVINAAHAQVTKKANDRTGIEERQT